MSYKLGTSKRKNKAISTFASIIVFLLLIIVFVNFGLGIIHSYYNFQKNLFGSDNSILFAHNELSLWVLVFWFVIIGFIVYMMIFPNSKVNSFELSRKNLFRMMIRITCLAIVLLFVSFFTFTDLATDGINYREGISYKEINYRWDDIDKIRVGYFYGPKHGIMISYIIDFKNGKQFDIANSDEFWDKVLVVDDFLTKKALRIERAYIDDYTYNQLYGEFHDNDAAGENGNAFDDIIVKLFRLEKR